MGTREQEGGRTVVERRRRPTCSRVALRAVVVEIVRDVIGIGDASKVTCVARIALRRSACVAV